MNEFKELIGSISGLANGETSINVEVALETRSIIVSVYWIVSSWYYNGYSQPIIIGYGKYS